MLFAPLLYFIHGYWMYDNE